MADHGTVDAYPLDGVTVVALAGEHDLSTCELIRRRLGDAAAGGPTVLDLEECEFLDSTALQAILEARSRATAGFALRIGTGAAVHRLLEMTSIGIPADATLEGAARLAQGA